MSEEKPKMPLKGLALYVALGIVAALTSVGVYAGVQYLYQVADSKKEEVQAPLDNPASAETRSETSNHDAGTTALKKTSESFRSVAKKVGPAVVNIKATRGVKKQKMPRPRNRRPAPGPGPGPEDEESPFPRDPFWDFFERFGAPHMMPEPGPQTSLGSGIIIDKNGTVVTNNHVIDGGTEIMVRIGSDNTEMKAKIIGTDPKTDLAVLKIEGAKDLPYAAWGDSDSAEVGDWAIAIGSPFALDQSVTVGIISAKGRNQVGLGNDFRADMIQTDAAINPGNSGGPLCDIDGNIIGVNTAIYSRSGGYMGIGFAIPANLAKDIVNRLLKEGKIVRGWLGVYIQPLDPELAKELGLKQGVGIHEVIEGSPAATAGLQAGDVVLEVDGKTVKEVTELQRRIGDFKPGQTVKLKVMGYADKKSRSITVKVGTLPEDQGAGPEERSESEQEPDRIGLILGTKGKDVVIKGMEPGSLSESMLGLEVGDIIVRVNRQNITSISAYKKALKNAKHVYLEVKRKGRNLFFQFALPE
jgi:serine protease Do